MSASVVEKADGIVEHSFFGSTTSDSPFAERRTRRGGGYGGRSDRFRQLQGWGRARAWKPCLAGTVRVGESTQNFFFSKPVDLTKVEQARRGRRCRGIRATTESDPQKRHRKRMTERGSRVASPSRHPAFHFCDISSSGPSSIDRQRVKEAKTPRRSCPRIRIRRGIGRAGWCRKMTRKHCSAARRSNLRNRAHPASR